MALTTTFSYQCGKCDFKWHYHKHEECLFMVEVHIVKTNHIYGTFTKSELGEELEKIPIYRKYCVYFGPQKRFKMSKSAGRMLKIIKAEA